MQEVTAVVLCGGKGERLRPVTREMPKPLVEVRGRPLLGHLLDFLSGHGVSRFVLCTGYMAEAFTRFAEESRSPSREIVCLDSGDATMTDRLRSARDQVGDRALICYGDTLANIDLAALRKVHSSQGALLTLTVYPLHSPFGIVEIGDDGERVTSFREKPVLPYWINIGFMMCERPALDGIQDGDEMPGFLSRLAREGRLGAFRHQGRHLTVNTEKDLSVAETELVEFYTVLGEQRV